MEPIPAPSDSEYIDDPLTDFNPSEYVNSPLYYDPSSQEWGYYDDGGELQGPLPLPPLDEVQTQLFNEQPPEQQQQTLKSALEAAISQREEDIIAHQEQVEALPVAMYTPYPGGVKLFKDVSFARSVLMSDQGLTQRSQYKDLKGYIILPARMLPRIRSGDGHHVQSTPLLAIPDGCALAEQLKQYL